MEGITFDDLKKNGYAKVNAGDKDLRTPHAEGNFDTPSGKCEFKSILAEEGKYIPAAFRAGYTKFQDRGYIDPLPGYSEPFESHKSAPGLAAKYPLNIISPKSHSFLNSQYANEMKQLRREGDPIVMLNPVDAEHRGIADGDVVRVFNDRGAFTGSAKVTGDTMSGVIASFHGHWEHGSTTKSAVNSVSSTRTANLGEAPTYSDILVEVAKETSTLNT